MNIVEPIFWQARNCPSQVALAAPGTPLNLVSYARLVTMVSSACRRLRLANLRAGDRVILKMRDPLFGAILTIALVRLGIVVVTAPEGDRTYPFEATATISDSLQIGSAGRHILAEYDWVTEAHDEAGQENDRAASVGELCFILAEPDEKERTGRRFFALTHDLLGARMARQDVFFGPSVSAASRLFDADGCTTPLGIQLLFSTLTRGAALFLMGDPTASFNALDTFEVESAVMTPRKLLDLVAFYEAKRDSQCGLKTVFVVGRIAQSTIERASKILSAKFSVGQYMVQPGMIASMPFHSTGTTGDSAGILLPGITVVGDGGIELEPGRTAKIGFRSDLSAELYGDAQKSDLGEPYFATSQSGYLTEDRILMFKA